MHNKVRKLRDRIVGTFLKELKESNFYQVDFMNSFKRCIDEIGYRKIEQIVCYGLGSFSNGVDISSRYQLALLLLLHEFLIENGTDVRSEIEIYDPSFDELDILTLASFSNPKFKMITENEYCGRKLEETGPNSCVLIYMPHLDKYLYNNLIGVNWDPDNLAKVIVLGNSFSEMIDSEPSSSCQRELYYMNLLVSNFKTTETGASTTTRWKKKIESKTCSAKLDKDVEKDGQPMIEISIDDASFEHSDIFNSLSFQFVNNSWLLWNPKKIQQSRLPNWTCVTSQPVDEWS